MLGLILCYDTYKTRFSDFPFQEESVNLLPEVLQQQLKTGNLPEVAVFDGNQNTPPKSNLPTVQEPILGNLLFRVPQQWEANGFVYSQP